MRNEVIGWTCKKCHRGPGGSHYGTRLGGYDRICFQCVKDNPIPPVEKKQKVALADFITTVRFLVPYWTNAFHLSPCHQCNHPTWGQPCRWCGFYPYGQYPEQKPENFLGKAHWDRMMGEQDLVLYYLSNRFANCAHTTVNNYWMDKALDAAKAFEWPTSEELWQSFGPPSTEAGRKLLHPYGDHVPQRTYLEGRIKQLEGNIEFHEWEIANRFAGQGVDSRLRMDREDLIRCKRQLEKL